MKFLHVKLFKHEKFPIYGTLTLSPSKRMGLMSTPSMVTLSGSEAPVKLAMVGKTSTVAANWVMERSGGRERERSRQKGRGGREEGRERRRRSKQRGGEGGRKGEKERRRKVKREKGRGRKKRGREEGRERKRERCKKEEKRKKMEEKPST